MFQMYHFTTCTLKFKSHFLVERIFLLSAAFAMGILLLVVNKRREKNARPLKA
jgi:hypothetical protein